MGDGYGRGLLPWMAQGSAEDDDDVQRLVNAADARRAAPRPIVPESIREHEAELAALRAENARLSTQVAQLQEEIECIADNNVGAINQSKMLRAENERLRLDLDTAISALRKISTCPCHGCMLDDLHKSKP